MSDKLLWVASIKAKVLENCELDSDGSEFQYVESFLLAPESEILVNEAKTKLAQIGLEFNELLQVKVYKSEEWKTDDDPIMNELLEEAAEQAKTSEELTFGPFTSSRFYE